MQEESVLSEISSEAATAATSFRDVVLSMSETKSGLVARRPTDLSLKIIKDGSESVSTEQQSPKTRITEPTPIAASKSSKYVKSHDLAFKDLQYRVKSGFLKSEIKTILKGICGNFKAGDLTAIIGPSGAGKSTLLNILSGYTTRNIQGEITVNGSPRELKKFYTQSAYIMQDTELQQFLTVMEAMHFSVNLKVGDQLGRSAKKERIKRILEAIGMYETRQTESGHLSGGQKKRLSVALELVTNPPIMFLDEPTSGLDSSTSTQLISLLKKLADEGRTIICTIHQPSALMFQMFDHLFAIADGQCIYTGSTNNLVPFLSELNLKCPESYNPADYLLEIATNDYGPQNPRLVKKLENGLLETYRKKPGNVTAQVDAMQVVEQMMEAGLMTPVTAPIIETNLSTPMATIEEEIPAAAWGSKEVTSGGCFVELESKKDCRKKKKKLSIQIDPSKLCPHESRYMSSFSNQLILLLQRTFLILWRDKSLTRSRIVIHALMGTFVGILYYGIGNDASNMLNNFRYIFFSIMFLMYTSFSSIILNFPLEFPMVSREHFNRWYSLRAYYMALTLADIPIQLICTLIFVVISYVLTNQPLEIYRLVLFFGMTVMASLVAQSIGLVVGATFNVKNGAIFGPFFISPFLIFSGFFVQMRDVHELMHWLFHISFLKYALEGSSLAIFGYERSKLDCNEIFCQYVRPNRFLQVIGMEDGSYLFATAALTFIFVMLRLISFYIMSYRLRMSR